MKRVSKETVLKTDHLTVVREVIETQNGKSDHYYSDHPDGVKVIPIKPGLTDNTFIMVRQARLPVNSYDWEFPGGRRAPGEPILQAAARELQEETGYVARDIRLLYSMYSSPSNSNSATAICLAIVEPVPGERSLEPSEEAAQLIVGEFSSADLHKKILSMDITDPHTLAAICVLTMGSQSATHYLNTGISEK